MLRTPEVHPNPENATPEALRLAMEAAPNKRSSIRLNAIRSLNLGLARATVCQQFCRPDRMVRLWIVPFNLGGIEAPISKSKSGRPRNVKLERVQDGLLPVLADLSQAGQVHWTGVKFHGYLQERLQIELGYSTTVRWLYELDSTSECPDRGRNDRRFWRNYASWRRIHRWNCGLGMSAAW